MLLATAAWLAGCAAAPRPRPPGPLHPGLGPGGPATLVLYDTTGPYGWLGELYAVAAGNLASRFGPWAAIPATAYQPGDLARFDAAIYLGSTYDEPLPDALLDDVLEGGTPVVWVHQNAWQLARRAPDFRAAFGYQPWRLDPSAVGEVRYKGIRLTRWAANRSALMTYVGLDRRRVEVLGEAVRADGTTLPWAVRSRHLTVVGDNPFTYLAETDRSLAFADLLFDLLAPRSGERHRALLRIEDVMPGTDPARLRALVDVLAAEGVPFGVAVIPRRLDPLGASGSRLPPSMGLADDPALVAALRDAVARGGTLLLHGHTHQFGAVPNPYSGLSGDDFEFFAARVEDGGVRLTGPVPGDSREFATSRVRSGLAEFDRAGLGRPAAFVYPHYAGSAEDSRAISTEMGVGYHRGLYFGGALGGGPDTAASLSQLFPYPVRDVYGFALLPENCGNYRPEPVGADAARLPADLAACARANRVVRDGFASVFFHWFLAPEALRETVRAIKAEGFTFVSPASVVPPPAMPSPAGPAPLTPTR
jgi:uncharacterized protein YdaL